MVGTQKYLNCRGGTRASTSTGRAGRDGYVTGGWECWEGVVLPGRCAYWAYGLTGSAGSLCTKSRLSSAAARPHPASPSMRVMGITGCGCGLHPGVQRCFGDTICAVVLRIYFLSLRGEHE
jgi:hypothetical protein